MINQNTRLLSICTSFRRPKMLPGMLESFYSTRSGDSTQIFVYIHDDDPFLEEYVVFMDNHKMKYGFAPNYCIGRHRCLQEVVNHVVFNMHREIPYYQIICDDHIYLTKNWDSILIQRYTEKSGGWGWCCGDDMQNDDWHTWAHPSAEIWSWKFVDTIGYVYPKSLTHRCLDLYTKDLGAAIENGVTFVPEVRIKHLIGAGTVTDDLNTNELYTDDSYNIGLIGLEKWKNEEKEIAVQRIKHAMG